jgi:N,N'-diacetyllegionaminate synthase
VDNYDNPILIFECANAHGGDLDLLLETISHFSCIEYNNKHIKFQPFHPETISLEDFSWHKIYHQLKFEPDEWANIIQIAKSNYSGVWLDLFDVYGATILSDNLSKIRGIKLQASVLENYELFSELEILDLSKIKLMINISGFDLSNLDIFIDKFAQLKIENLILQIGHQAYPTEIKDTGLQKVAILKAAYPQKEICVADHVDASHAMATIIPLLSLSSGASVIEKHICINRNTAEFDFYSALEYEEMKSLTKRIVEYNEITQGLFISKSEKYYLDNSVQIPVTRMNLPKGSMLSNRDVVYRRTDQEGMTYQEITKIQSLGYILNKDIEKYSTITESDFDLSTVGVIVACRMKSSRLKKKAILDLAGETSIERCLSNCLKMPVARKVVLATSTTKEDAVLADYTLDGKVKFWKGDPDDVIKRYLAACEEYNIDTIIRVTADCPVISTEISKVLLDHHFSTGADYTAAKECAVGTGCEIYSVEVLQRVIDYLGAAEHSEYMTWYMQNNSDIFKVEIVELPESMVRDYRLTLDYPEDLLLFNKLFAELSKHNQEASLDNVFNILDSNPELGNINSHLTLQYKTDESLIKHLNKVTKIPRS